MDGKGIDSVQQIENCFSHMGGDFTVIVKNKGLDGSDFIPAVFGSLFIFDKKIPFCNDGFIGNFSRDKRTGLSL